MPVYGAGLGSTSGSGWLKTTLIGEPAGVVRRAVVGFGPPGTGREVVVTVDGPGGGGAVPPALADVDVPCATGAAAGPPHAAASSSVAASTHTNRIDRPRCS